MKFNLTTLLLLTTVIVLAVGWIWERRQFENKLHREISSQVNVEIALTSALNKNSLWLTFDRSESDADPEAFRSNIREQDMLDSIAYLYLNASNATDSFTNQPDGVTFNTNQPERMMHFAGDSLRLLGITKPNELDLLIMNRGGINQLIDDQILHSGGTMDEQFKSFVERAIQFNVLRDKN